MNKRAVESKSPRNFEVDSFEIVTFEKEEMKPLLNTFHFNNKNFSKNEMGEIFGVIQIKNNSEEFFYLPNLIAQTIKKSFFKNKKNLKIRSRFKNALTETNKEILKETSNSNEDWKEKVSAVITVFSKNELLFSLLGSGCLLHLDKNLNLKPLNHKSRKKDDSPRKDFSNISQFKITEEEKIILTSQNLFELIPENKLKKQIKGINFGDFEKKVKSIIDLKKKNFGSIVINVKESDYFKEVAFDNHKEKEEQINNFFGEKISFSEKDESPSPFEEQPEIYIKEDTRENKKEEIKEKNTLIMTKKIVNKSNTDDCKLKNKKSCLEKLKQKISKVGDSSKNKIKILPEVNIKKVKNELRSIKNNKPVSIILLISTVIALILTIFSLDKESSFSNGTYNYNPKKELNNKTKLLDNKEKVFDAKSIKEMESKVISMINTEKEGSFLYTENKKLFLLDSNQNFKEITVTKKIDNVKSIVYMQDLRLIFLISPKKIISYSPVTDKFYDEKIVLPKNLEIGGTGVYLTFLYIFDKNSGQLYRYPRAEGGFGTPVEWFKETITGSNVNDIAIDDSVRLIYQDGKVEKYFQRKMKSSFLFDVEPKIITSKIFTNIDLEKYYVLDSKNGKIIEVNKVNDEIINEYVNPNLAKANNFLVKEKNNKIIFSKDNEIFEMNF